MTTTQNAPTWTAALRAACGDLATGHGSPDIASRAAEIWNGARVGQTLTALNVEFINAMRSRFGDQRGEERRAVISRKAEDGFDALWGAAWAAANPPPAPTFTDLDWDGVDPVTLKLDGFTLTAKTVADDCPDKPWDREDGHGPVRLVKAGEEKREGERYLTWGRDRWAYDWDGALTQAWGDNDGDHAQAESHVAADFDRLQRFTDGHWGYVGVCVTVHRNGHQLTGDYGHALWGIESDSGSYFANVADELTGEALDEARQILADIIEGDGA